ncbi:MAG TPA: hypothetical protein DD761_14220 [Cyanobacteria bacterium UBA11691]|nr:hypothetical protein [Cyanobacteria bacterium UBA11691]
MLEINCPCCSYPLLRHIRSTGMYWYCTHCHQEMPVRLSRSFEIDLSLTSPFIEEWIGEKHQNMLVVSA